MPADDNNHDSMRAMVRLLRAFSAWRQRRAATRRAHLHSFMGLSDRALADIGVRRADAYGAMIGFVPLCRTGATSQASSAETHELPRRPVPMVETPDLGVAA